jgi:hypothetical protein
VKDRYAFIYFCSCLPQLFNRCVCASTNIRCFWRLFCSYSIWSKTHTAYFPTAQVYNPTYLLVLWLSCCFISLKNLFPKVSQCCFTRIFHTQCRMQDLRLSQQREWKFKYCGTWRHVNC